MPLNSFCHVEFHVTDLARAQTFFETMFGWSFRGFSDEMVVFGQGDQHLGGLIKVDAPEPGMSPSVWIEVDSIDTYLSKAPTCGGRVWSEKAPVPHVGFSAMVADPDGNRVGLVEFAPQG